MKKYAKYQTKVFFGRTTEPYNTMMYNSGSGLGTNGKRVKRDMTKYYK